MNRQLVCALLVWSMGSYGMQSKKAISLYGFLWRESDRGKQDSWKLFTTPPKEIMKGAHDDEFIISDGERSRAVELRLINNPAVQNVLFRIQTPVVRNGASCVVESSPLRYGQAVFFLSRGECSSSAIVVEMVSHETKDPREYSTIPTDEELRFLTNLYRGKNKQRDLVDDRTIALQ